MKKRIPYLIAFLAVLGIEVLIGAFVRDRFIRPYMGDVLVAVLLCCLARCVWPHGTRWLSVGVFGFCLMAELVQLMGLSQRLGLEGTVLSIILGATFDWADIVCYFTGCGLFAVAERWFPKP